MKGLVSIYKKQIILFRIENFWDPSLFQSWLSQRKKKKIRKSRTLFRNLHIYRNIYPLRYIINMDYMLIKGSFKLQFKLSFSLQFSGFSSLQKFIPNFSFKKVQTVYRGQNSFWKDFFPLLVFFRKYFQCDSLSFKFSIKMKSSLKGKNFLNTFPLLPLQKLTLTLHLS